MKRFQEWLSDMSVKERPVVKDEVLSKELSFMVVELQNNRVSIFCGGIFPITYNMLASIS